ncbi:MAG TPA: glycosyltransferase family 39 protein [Solirubrobacteraceae bacterium]
MTATARPLTARARAEAVPLVSPYAIALVPVLVVALVLRLWGAKHGLPYAYNADENGHFVPKAIGLFGHSWNPNYFVNPPSYTYLLHIVLLVWFGGREAVSHTYATNPTEVFLIARATSAILGTLAVWLVYLAGARFFDRRVGLLGAGLMAVAFLPVFYSHLGLNDVPTLAPVCLALLGIGGVLRRGQRGDYVVAGIGLGLACATKYTGGIMLLPLLGAAAAQYTAAGGRDSALRGLGAAAGAAIVAFLIANPYALITPSNFLDGINHQSAATDEAGGKVGLTQDGGIIYYLWTLTWGLGWVPALAALGGAVALWRDERRLVWVMVPAPILFLIFMGTQGRYFGRWLLPIFPIICLLAAYAALELADRAGRRRPALRPTFTALVVVALCLQGLIFSIHAGLVLSRPDTRNVARAWLVAHVPATTKIVVEPAMPDSWAQDVGRPSPLTSNGYRWVKFATSRSKFDLNGNPIREGPGRIVSVEDYEKTTYPSLVDQYERGGYCYVISASTQSGRAFAAPKVVPQAVKYYRRLRARSTVVYRVSPYGGANDRVSFNFDWSFDFYPLSYHRPGPVVTIYHLNRGACAPTKA